MLKASVGFIKSNSERTTFPVAKTAEAWSYPVVINDNFAFMRCKRTHIIELLQQIAGYHNFASHSASSMNLL